MTAALQLATQRRKELQAAGKLEVLDPIEKARRDPKSLRKAINANCWGCVGAGADPNPRQLIADCVCRDCSLWPVRPWQEKATAL